MKAKDFVKQKMPLAKAERQTTRGKDQYWLIRNGRETMYFASGNSESNAWVNAKQRIIEQETDERDKN